ncbi:MAG: DeoR/GlpR family DNA-binding transcription regulator [Acidobacteriota bacterium]
MRSSWAEIQLRRERLASVLRQEGYLSVADLAARLGISEATVRRDLNALQQENRITRTYGGALSEFDALFMPFYERNRQNAEAKRRIAQTAVLEIEDGETVFFDAGSTVYAVTEALLAAGLRIRAVTNSLPVAELFASHEHGELHLLGGRLLPHQLIVAGAGAGLSLSAWRFDAAFLGAEGMTPDGLWNSRDEISEFQRHVCARTDRAVFCLDASKLGRTAPSFLLPWPAIHTLVTDAPAETVLGWGLRPDQLRRPDTAPEENRHGSGEN